MDATVKPLQVTIPPPEAAPARNFWQSDDAPSFDDMLDIINPLQHIPVVSSAYRDMTGDQISSGARLLGGAVFGGPIGFLASLFNTIVESQTGGTVGDHVYASLTGQELPAHAPLAAQAVASAEPTPRYVSASRFGALNAYVSIQNA